MGAARKQTLQGRVDAPMELEGGGPGGEGEVQGRRRAPPSTAWRSGSAPPPSFPSPSRSRGSAADNRPELRPPPAARASARRSRRPSGSPRSWRSPPGSRRWPSRLAGTPTGPQLVALALGLAPGSGDPLRDGNGKNSSLEPSWSASVRTPAKRWARAAEQGRLGPGSNACGNHSRPRRASDRAASTGS